MNRRRQRGFTLVEMMTVMGIVAVLTGMAGVGLMYGNARVKLSSTAFEVSALVPVVQMRATATGKPNFLVFYAVDKDTFGVAHLECDDNDPAKQPPVWTSVKANDLTSLKGDILNKIDVSATKALELGTVTSLGSTALPAPFNRIPIVGAGTSGLRAACSFCITASNGEVGALRFWPDGRVTVATGASDTAGAAFALNGKAPGEKARTRVITMSLPSGAVKVVEP